MTNVFLSSGMLLRQVNETTSYSGLTTQNLSSQNWKRQTNIICKAQLKLDKLSGFYQYAKFYLDIYALSD